MYNTFIGYILLLGYSQLRWLNHCWEKQAVLFFGYFLTNTQCIENTKHTK